MTLSCPKWALLLPTMAFCQEKCINAQGSNELLKSMEETPNFLKQQ